MKKRRSNPLNSSLLLAGGTIASVLMVGLQAPAEAITFTGSSLNPDSGNMRSAEATFEIMGNMLSVTLTNTSTDSQTNNSDVLTGLAWMLPDGVIATTTLDSVLRPAGSLTCINVSGPNNCPANDGVYPLEINAELPIPPNFRGGWALPATPGVITNLPTANIGIGTNGLAGTFPGGQVQLPAGSPGVGNTDFGLVTDVQPGSGNQMDDKVFVDNTITAKLTLPTLITEADIKNVFFLYGTAIVPPGGTPGGEIPVPGEPVPPTTTPEPGTVAGLGLLSLLAIGTRKKQKAQ